jgi:hypothetical protein
MQHCLSQHSRVGLLSSTLASQSIDHHHATLQHCQSLCASCQVTELVHNVFDSGPAGMHLFPTGCAVACVCVCHRPVHAGGAGASAGAAAPLAAHTAGAAPWLGSCLGGLHSQVGSQHPVPEPQGSRPICMFSSKHSASVVEHGWFQPCIICQALCPLWQNLLHGCVHVYASWACLSPSAVFRAHQCVCVCTRPPHSLATPGPAITCTLCLPPALWGQPSGPAAASSPP